MYIVVDLNKKYNVITFVSFKYLLQYFLQMSLLTH